MSIAARRPWIAVLLVLLGAALFGTLGPMSRTAYDRGLTPFAWVAWRAGIGGLGLWAVIARRRGVRSTVDGLRAARVTERHWLIVAIAASACLNLAIFVAFQRTTIALALLAFYTYPAIVAGVSAALGHERLDGGRRAALALAIGGMVAVVGGGLQPGADVKVDLLGLTLALLAAACQATFVVASRGYASIRAEEAMGAILGGSALIAVVVTVVVEGPTAVLLPLNDPGLVAILLGVGLFAAALPSFLFLTGIRRLGPVRTGILMLFEPVVGVTLAAALLGEGITPLQAAGGATILLAALLVQRAAGSHLGWDAAGRDLESVEESPVVPSPGGP